MIVVSYHGVWSPRSPVSVPPSRLAQDLQALVEAGFVFVTMDQCADWLERRIDLPARAAAVTFDDGYASVCQDGLPILRRLGVPATVYVIAGRIGLDNRWSGQHPRVPSMPLMTGDDIRRLVDGGVTVGSHSMSHTPLPMLDARALDDEMSTSAERLAAISGQPVRHFSYPYGRHSSGVRQAVARWYRTAVTNACAPLRADSDPHLIPRIDAHDLTVAAMFRLLSSPLLDRYLGVRRLVRRGRRIAERATGGSWEGVR